jgi:UDP-2,3-diacylglucosamine hydrolase
MIRLFVSDLHLDAQSPAATQQFLDFLQGPARQAAALYILGDLFEAWIGDDAADASQQRVIEGLRELSAAGVACFALHGNRDFLLGEAFSAQSGVQLLPDPVVAQFAQESVLLTHGDTLCIDDQPYQELRSSVREPDWQQRFLSLPVQVRQHLAQRARAGSRAHTQYSAQEIMDVNPQAVQQAMQAVGVQRLIHGHTHRPARHALKINQKPAERIVLGAWYEQGSVLREENGLYDLQTLSRASN